VISWPAVAIVMLNHCSCSHGLGGRAVDEAWGGEHLEDVLVFGAIECLGGRLAGLLEAGKRR